MTREEFLAEYAKLAKNYKPSSESLTRIKNVNLLIVIGPTGVGKTTLINNLNIVFVPSDTTRPIRPEEKDGVDMFFLTDYIGAISDVRSGKFLQVAVGASGDLYATRASSYPSSGWATMPVITDVVSTFRHLGFAKTLSVFITPPDYAEWMRRIDMHHLPKDVMLNRMNEAMRSFEFSLADKNMHFILNDEIGAAAAQIKNLLNGEVDQHREDEARAAAKQCLDQLKKTFNL